MSTRGPYAKGVAKRGEILDAALRVIAAEGYSNASVRQIADAVGLSQNGLLHYFGSRDGLLVAVVRHRDELRVDDDGVPFAPLDDPADFAVLRDGLLALVRRNTATPGLVHLFASLVAESAHPAHPAHAYFAERYARVRTDIARAVRALQERGAVRSDVDPESAAVQVVALLDGLQNQWLHDRGLDMAAHLDDHLRGFAIR